MSLITYLTRIHFADGVLEDALSLELRRLGVVRPVIMSDEAGRSGDCLSRLEDALPPGIRPIWCDTNGPGEGGTFRDADAIICLGGSDALDAGRGATVADGGRGTRPLIAIPTTIGDIGLPPARANGSGALPAAILCDPTLLVDTDRIAIQSFDILSHCIEAFACTTFNPPADGIALEGARLAWLNIEGAVAGDAGARRAMFAARLNAGLSAQKGLGGAEALTVALEAEAGLAGRHGLLHPSVLPQVLAFNAPAVGDRYQRLGAALNLPTGSDLATDIADLGARLGLPVRLGDAGLTRDGLGRAAQRALADPGALTNPRHATRADYLDVLEAAF